MALFDVLPPPPVPPAVVQEDRQPGNIGAAGPSAPLALKESANGHVVPVRQPTAELELRATTGGALEVVGFQDLPAEQGSELKAWLTAALKTWVMAQAQPKEPGAIWKLDDVMGIAPNGKPLRALEQASFKSVGVDVMFYYAGNLPRDWAVSLASGMQARLGSEHAQVQRGKDAASRRRNALASLVEG